MEDYTAEMIKDMAFSFCPQCGTAIIRAQYFSTLQNPAMTISNGKLRFNTSCLKKFEDVEYVELLLNSVDRCVAIRPCEKGNPNAIHWGRLKEGRWCASTLGCRGLAITNSRCRTYVKLLQRAAPPHQGKSQEGNPCTAPSVDGQHPA